MDISTLNASMFNSQQQLDISELVRVNKEIKDLEDKKKDLSDRVKTYMVNHAVSSLNWSGSTLQLISSSRVTVSKATKDEFVAKLNAMGKGALLKIEIEVDKETLQTEMDLGTIDPNFVNQYVKFTDILTLRCS